jgi:hypothetical protein
MEKKTFYFSETNYCYVESTPVWEPFENRTEQVEDSAFRMGAWLIANHGKPGKEELERKIVNSMLLCFSKGKVLRWPGHDGSDTSRDQLIALLSAFHMHYPEKAKDIAKQLKFRISPRYICTLSLWFWIQYIATGSKLNLSLFKIFFYAEAIPTILWTLLVMKICGIKNQFSELIENGEFLPKRQKLPLLKNWLVQTAYPGFALYLSALMFFSLGEKSRFMVWYTRNRAPYNNIVRRMFGEKTSPYNDGGPCINDFWPHRHFDISNDVYFRNVEKDGNLGYEFHSGIFGYITHE